MCSCEDWDEDALFECVRRAYPYGKLRREEYDRILEMLSQGIAAKRGRYGAYLFRDMVNRRLRGRRGARLAAITSGGAIPDTALFTVVAQPDEIVVGTLDEDFAVESNAGDIMLLGNTSWRIRRVESNYRTSAGGGCAWRAAEYSLLARRGSGAHRRAFASRGRIARARQRAAAEYGAAAGAGKSGDAALHPTKSNPRA